MSAHNLQTKVTSLHAVPGTRAGPHHLPCVVLQSRPPTKSFLQSNKEPLSVKTVLTSATPSQGGTLQEAGADMLPCVEVKALTHVRLNHRPASSAVEAINDSEICQDGGGDCYNMQVNTCPEPHVRREKTRPCKQTDRSPQTTGALGWGYGAYFPSALANTVDLEVKV